MIIFIKLLLAHLLGDFLLQPSSWVEAKEMQKHKSIYLYFHTILHGLLAFTFVGRIDFWMYAVALAAFHGMIDLTKLYLQNSATKRYWFTADQILHLITIAAAALLYSKIDYTGYEIDNRFWIYATGVFMLTTPASIIIKNIISIWTPHETSMKGTSDSELAQQTDLQNAGKYIGILERLFVFFFILTGNFASIGFLMAAKSIFRFGDLTQAKDRKLTEYVLIGTLMSFGTAIAAGFLVKFALRHL